MPDNSIQGHNDRGNREDEYFHISSTLQWQRLKWQLMMQLQKWQQVVGLKLMKEQLQPMREQQ